MKGTPKLVGYGLAVSLFTLLITSTLSTIQVSAQSIKDKVSSDQLFLMAGQRQQKGQYKGWRYLTTTK